MSILREILTWSQSLPAWQQDAIRRLYSNRELSAPDIDDLYALAKAEVGIEDSEGRTPQGLADAQVAVAPVPTQLVQLTAIKELSNLNALVNGGHLPISPEGLTVIYGENGAGKSGYARALKHACRARDQREPILPDARLDPDLTGSPKAVFEVLIDGQPTELSWEYQSEAPEPLSEIAIFDTHCARAYIDNEGDFAYTPYGLDILAGLVDVCSVLKQKAINEKSNNLPSKVAFERLISEHTEVGRSLINFPRNTNAELIESLATLSDAESVRLESLRKALSETDPKQKAQALRQKAARFSSLSSRIELSVKVISTEKVNELRELVTASKIAKNAAELAAREFKETPGQLPGTGGEEWKVLFESARSFAAISHPSLTFPDLLEDSECPLCQNPLGQEGISRLKRFDAFILQAAEKAANEARIATVKPYRAIENEALELLLEQSLCEELDEINPEMSSYCITLQESLRSRKKAVLNAAVGKIEWDAINDLSYDPSPKLAEAVNSLVAQAVALELTIDETAKALLTSEFNELEARRKLGEVKNAVLEAMTRHELCVKLDTIIGINTTNISRKSTDLSKTMATQELADALKAELKKLKVNDLQVVMKPISPRGRTQFKLTLELPGGGNPSDILSEGEQRAIAIASFLAETSLAKGRGGVVFDDPVSSLDHRRRWEVAERLAAEAKVRQVIIFTHDIYFLCILEQKADELGTRLVKQFIRRSPEGFGVYSKDLPFDVITTKDRVGYLRNMLVDIRRAQKSGDEELQRRLTKEVYGLLRLAWERSIEEVLFNGAIQRFGEGVSTLRLRAVTVTDDDYKKIDNGMTKSSKFEHDAAAAVGRLPIPDCDELSADIETLEDWRKTIDARNKEIAKSR